MKSKIFALDNWLLLCLFIITFYPLTYTGYLTQDDTVRHLSVMAGGLFSELWGIAEATGRITLAAHFFLTHIAYLVDNYIYRKIFLIVPHIIVLFLFSFTLRNYIKSKSVSIIFIILFLAFFTNSWEHNLYGSYPFAFHVSITSIILSGYFLLKYLVGSRQKYLISAVILYCVAIFTYEQFVVYVMFFLALIFMLPRTDAYSMKRSFLISLPFLLSTVIYLIIVFAFKHYVPGSNVGTTIAVFDIVRIAKTLKTFVASAFPLYLPFSYVGRIYHSTPNFNYSISSIIENLHYIWAIKALIVSALVVRTLAKSDYTSTGMQILRQAVTLFLLLIMSVSLISLSVKYQDWVINSGALAYSSSSYVAQICATALIALLLTYVSNSKLAKLFPFIFYSLVIASISYIVLVTEMHNADVLADQKNSANKWAAIESLYRSGDLGAIPSGSIIYAPEFIHTGGIASVREDYWASFLALKYGVNLNITGEISEFYNPRYKGKRFELKYDSRYPNDKYSIVLRHSLLGDYFVYIPDYGKTGFYGWEFDGNGHPFQWSKNASSLIICNGTEKNSAVVLTAIVQTDAERDKPLIICSLDHCNNYLLSSTQTKIEENYIVPPGCRDINLRTDSAAVNAPNDSRSLYFRISDLEISKN
jgi:hypothetical protein